MYQRRRFGPRFRYRCVFESRGGWEMAVSFWAADLTAALCHAAEYCEARRATLIGVDTRWDTAFMPDGTMLLRGLYWRRMRRRPWLFLVRGAVHACRWFARRCPGLRPIAADVVNVCSLVVVGLGAIYGLPFAVALFHVAVSEAPQ